MLFSLFVRCAVGECGPNRDVMQDYGEYVLSITDGWTDKKFYNWHAHMHTQRHTGSARVEYCHYYWLKQIGCCKSLHDIMPFITFSDVSTCSTVLSTVLRYRICSGSFYIPLSWATFNLFYCLVIDLKLYKRLVHLLVRCSICWFFIGLWWSSRKVLKHALPLLPTRSRVAVYLETERDEQSGSAMVKTGTEWFDLQWHKE